MNNEHGNKLEQRVRFVAKRYREGSLDPDKAWQKFASEHAISRKVSFRRYWIGAAAVVLVLVGLGTWFTVSTYIKLLSQLFGDRMYIGNAAGCSSAISGGAPIRSEEHTS